MPKELKPYHFNRVTGPAFTYVCLKCDKHLDSSRGAWADSNGAPFKAYYCDPCKQQAELERWDQRWGSMENPK